MVLRDRNLLLLMVVDFACVFANSGHRLFDRSSSRLVSTLVSRTQARRCLYKSVEHGSASLSTFLKELAIEKPPDRLR